MMISYAQNAEDVVLNRFFSSKKNGFYVDVGAADPVEDSVTKHFYDNGWRGINIEPQKVYFDSLKKEREHDVNLQMGISSKKGERKFFQVVKTPGWSTFDEKTAKKIKMDGLEINESTISVDSLDSVFSKYVKGKTVNFLKIDVEGHESEVVASLNLKKYRPMVLVIEKTHSSEWVKNLEDSGYITCLDDGVNLFFLRNEDKKIRKELSIPANVLDGYDQYRYMKVIDELRDENEMLKNKLTSILEL